MRLWFSPTSEVPIYRQLVTQVTLAILSGDLKPGDRLPSTRELARRFSIHPNTVSAGYRQLARDGWVEYRHGSGVYTKNNAIPPSTPEQILDQHIAAFFQAVRELRLPATAIRQRVAEWIASPPPDHFLLIDPDPDAREILLAEIQQLTNWPWEFRLETWGSPKLSWGQFRSAGQLKPILFERPCLQALSSSRCRFDRRTDGSIPNSHRCWENWSEWFPAGSISPKPRKPCWSLPELIPIC